MFTVFMHDAKIWITALTSMAIRFGDVASDFASTGAIPPSPVLYDELVIVASDHKEGGNLTPTIAKRARRFERHAASDPQLRHSSSLQY